MKRSGDDKIKTYMRTGSKHLNAIETKSQNIAIEQHTTDTDQKRKIRPMKLDSMQCTTKVLYTTGKNGRKQISEISSVAYN